MTKISAVINTRNEAEHLDNCLKSLNFVDEIVVIDMESEDDCQKIAHKYTDHVYSHRPLQWVEPARNFGIKKATGDWILIVDPDETIPKSLASKLIEIADGKLADFVRIPRKNIIFGDWVKHSRWWPDYNIRFFKRGKVEWQDIIHSIPITYGNGLNLDATEEMSIEHHHYSSIEQYLQRSMRYAQVQAQELEKDGYEISFLDPLEKPFSEFLSRFFAGEGYKDGFHGFVLAILQAFSVFLVYLKVWQKQGFKKQEESYFLPIWQKTVKKHLKEFKYWSQTVLIHTTKSKTTRFFIKIRRKFGI